MPSCEYCDREAITKRDVFDADMGCFHEINVCLECAEYIDEWEGR